MLIVIRERDIVCYDVSEGYKNVFIVKWLRLFEFLCSQIPRSKEKKLHHS